MKKASTAKQLTLLPLPDGVPVPGELAKAQLRAQLRNYGIEPKGVELAMGERILRDGLGPRQAARLVRSIPAENRR